MAGLASVSCSGSSDVAPMEEPDASNPAKDAREDETLPDRVPDTVAEENDANAESSVGPEAEAKDGGLDAGDVSPSDVRPSDVSVADRPDGSEIDSSADVERGADADASRTADVEHDDGEVRRDAGPDVPDDGGASSDADAGVPDQSDAGGDANEDVSDAGAPEDENLVEAGVDGSTELGDAADASAVDAETSTPMPMHWTVDTNVFVAQAAVGACGGDYAFFVDCSCQPNSEVTLYTSTEALPPPSDTPYQVFAAHNLTSALSVPDNQIAVEITVVGAKTDTWWGQTGSVTIASNGSQLVITFDGTAMREKDAAKVQKPMSGYLLCGQ